MRQLDWHMIVFVGFSLIQEYWLIWGLPRVYYWEMQKSATE
ncbi:hypothetical protein [Virgibacillus sp. MG-45]